MSFGSNLQFMRKMHNDMTQEELAEKMSVSRQTISKWEIGSTLPELEKALALSKLLNCSLDELFKDDLNSGSDAFSNLRVETVKGFRYYRYIVVSPNPEYDACKHMMGWVKARNLKPDYIGWDFDAVSKEQINVYRMHGYCVACILPSDYQEEGLEILSQPDARYAGITIENPDLNPFSMIPNAFKTISRYIEVNGLKSGPRRDVIDCFERGYEENGVSKMDVYIAVD